MQDIFAIQLVYRVTFLPPRKKYQVLRFLPYHVHCFPFLKYCVGFELFNWFF